VLSSEIVALQKTKNRNESQIESNLEKGNKFSDDSYVNAHINPVKSTKKKCIFWCQKA